MRSVFSLRGVGLRHIGGLGAGALGIDKGEQLHIAHLLHQFQRLYKVCFGLAGEANDNVTGKGDAGHRFASIFDQLHVLLHRVVAVHLLQQFIGAALHRQVQVLAQLRLGGNGVDQLVAGILGAGWS